MEPVVIVRVGAAGGDITLLGQTGPQGSWQFKRVTVDQTEMLLGDADASWRSESGWVDGWEAALERLDRYPWAMLHPLEVHPGFRELVKVALEMRIAKRASSQHTVRAKMKWERLLDGSSEDA